MSVEDFLDSDSDSSVTDNESDSMSMPPTMDLDIDVNQQKEDADASLDIHSWFGDTSDGDSDGDHDGDHNHNNGNNNRIVATQMDSDFAFRAANHHHGHSNPMRGHRHGHHAQTNNSSAVNCLIIPWEGTPPNIQCKQSTLNPFLHCSDTNGQKDHTEKLFHKYYSNCRRLLFQRCDATNDKTGRTIKVWAIPLTWTTKNLRKTFSIFGEIIVCSLQNETNVLLRHSFIKFRHSSMAEFAMNYDSGLQQFSSFSSKSKRKSNDGQQIAIEIENEKENETDHKTNTNAKNATKNVNNANGFEIDTHTKTNSKTTAKRKTRPSLIIQPLMRANITFGVNKYLINYIKSRPRNLSQLQMEVNKFMSKFDRLKRMKRDKWKNTPRRNRGWIQTRDKEGWTHVHYPNKTERKKHKAIRIPFDSSGGNNDGDSADMNADQKQSGRGRGRGNDNDNDNGRGRGRGRGIAPIIKNDPFNAPPTLQIYDKERKKEYYSKNRINRYSHLEKKDMRYFRKRKKIKTIMKQELTEKMRDNRKNRISIARLRLRQNMQNNAKWKTDMKNTTQFRQQRKFQPV